MTEPSQRRRRWLLFGVLAAGVVIVDQLSKLYVDANFQVASANPLPGGSAPTPILGEFVRIAKSYNTGGIFGLFGNSALVLALSSLVVIGLIHAGKLDKSKATITGVIMFACGALPAIWALLTGK